MKRKMKRVLGILLSVVLMLGMLPEMAIPVLAYDNNPYADLAGTATTVRFNNMDWYVIADDSTAVNAGTVTLLLKRPEETTEFKDRRKFNENYGDDNVYSTSKVKSFLDSLTTEGGSFAAVASAIADTTLSDVNVSNAKLYLLSKTEIEAITNTDVLTFSPTNYYNWWTRTPKPSNNVWSRGPVANSSFSGSSVTDRCIVRPALRLDLSKVIYRNNAGTRVFSLVSEGCNVSVTCGANATISGSTSQTGLIGEMTTVTCTAEEGYHFPLFTDITDNGITATRVNKTTVTVSGTPTYDVSIIIPDAVTGYSVSLTGGANADRYGFATQTGISDSMTPVSYSAHTGYLFEPFEEIAQNGVTVTRIDKTSVIVSGTPDDDVVITVPDAREGYTVTITAGANTTPDNNENTTQTNITEEMETVTYSADEGYHFALFPDITRDGITVTRTNDKKVTVSGTPTDDVSITVPDAEAVTEDSYGAFHITGEDSEEELAGKRISFGGHEWYVIKDDSTGENTGTLTLLSAYFMGKSAFNKSGRGIDYSDSDIRNAVNSLLEDDGNLKAVSGAMDPVTVISYKYDSTSEVQNTIDNQKLWLLSVSEAENLPGKIRACALAPGKTNEDWWLRSPGRDNNHACFMSALANVSNYGYISDVYGIRPALKLKLSKVVFDSESKTFRLPDTHSVTLSGGEGAVTSGGSTYQSDVTGEMNTVTYTAKKEYHFEEFATVSENGVTVSRIDNKTVTVSGTPTADVSITVPDATKGAYADYFVTDGDSYTTVNEKKVRFGGHEWFVIDDDSTGENKGTLTLLSAECLGVSKFNEDSFAGNHYSESDIRAAVLNLLETDNDLKAVSSAMNALAVTTDVKNHDTGEPTQDITDGDKLWLLSIDEANDISALVRECGDASGAHSNRWWLRSPGSSTSEEDAATVSGEDGAVDSSGWTVHYIFGIRPALQLDLSKVDFKKDYNTFVLLDTYIVEVSGGGNTSVVGSKLQIGVSGVMKSVTYTADNGYHFDEFDDIVQNGVTVKRIDNKTVTVTGTPTADVKIDVPDAIDDLAGAYYRLCVNEEDTLESLANKKVIFGGHEWYVLEDNSTAKNEGTLTLFAVECFGASQYNTSENWRNDYEDSLVRTAVLNLLETDEGLKAVNDAIIPVVVTQMQGSIDANTSGEAPESIGSISNNGDKLWLLSYTDASNLPENVRFCPVIVGTEGNCCWCLRTKDYGESVAYYIDGYAEGNHVYNGEIYTAQVTEEFGIRPALRLDLSAVDFDSVTRTFSLAQQAKPVEPEIITDPSAKTLTFNEQAQELITAGKASGGTFVYVVTTENTAPTADLYSESIPKGTNAGTYYVWYMVKGDGNHSNTEAASLPVTIAKAAPDFTQPENKTLTCAQTLSNITLPTGFALKQADQTLSFGDNTVTLTYTPSDTTNYKKVETDIVVTVSNHNLTKTNAFQPSCSKTGNCEYWTCSVCNRHFSDDLGKTEIQETDIEALSKTESTGTSNPATTPDPDKTEEKDQPADFGTPITSLEDNAEVVVISGKDEKPAVEYKGSTDKEAKDVTVPDTVTDGKVTYDVVEIADNAFKGNKTVERVKIGKNIKKISENAFSGCTKLKYVDLSQSGVEIIDKNAFNGTKIKTVTLPDTLKEVRSGAFSGCKSLTTITFGKNTRSFGKDVLKNSRKVRTVIFKAGKVPTPKNLKNLVKSLKNKKATIKVQKKLYSKYRTALKKAGFKGKVKKIK